MLDFTSEREGKGRREAEGEEVSEVELPISTPTVLP